MNVLEGLQDQSSEKKIRIVHLKTKKDIAMLIEKIVLTKCEDLTWNQIPISGDFNEVKEILDKNDQVNTSTSLKWHP